jgi:predicted transposase YbfD/YdcC
MARSRTTVDLSEVVGHFETLEDPRSTINRLHPLPSVVTISLMAILAGADGPTGIHKWAVAKSELLLKCLDLPNGLPSKDVIRRVLCALKVEAFQACFVNWLKSLSDSAEQNQTDMEAGRKHLAVDGKTMKGSHDRANGIGPMHLVSVWLSNFGLTLAQVSTDQKSNEITAIPEVLRLVDLKDAIITIDAMGTQTEIAAQIADGGGDYVLALKGNQGNLHKDVIDFVDQHVSNDFADIPVRRLEEKPESGHGRLDSRIYIQFSVPDSFRGQSRWKGLRTIGLVVYNSMEQGKEKLDIRYYISSLPLGIKQFAKVVRQHWGIESTCHWSLDVTYREDSLRTRQRCLAENLAWLRRFTLSLLKQHPGKDSLAMKRRMCGWNDGFLMQVLAGNAP